MSCKRSFLSIRPPRLRPSVLWSLALILSTLERDLEERMPSLSGTLSDLTPEKAGIGQFSGIPSLNDVTGALLIGCYFAIS